MIQSLTLIRPLTGVDLESTGVDPRTDHIVEIAMVKVYPDQTMELFHRYVNPGVAIPEAASRVHGIVDADVVNMPSFREIAGELQQFLDGTDLAGFGLGAFDLPLLAAEFARVGRSFCVASRSVIDVLTIYWRHHPRDLASAVRAYLGRDHVNAHRAMSDVEVTLEILDRQVTLHELPVTPKHLHNAFVEVDVSRRFRRNAHQDIVFAFGKHLGKRLQDVATSDPSYLAWMLKQPLLDDTRARIVDAISARMSPSAAHHQDGRRA